VINFTATNWTGSSRTQQQTLQTVAVSTCHTGNLSTNTSGSGITMAQAANVEISARLAQPELIKTSRDAVYAPNGLYFVKSGVVGRELTFFPQIFDKGVGAFAESPLSSSLSFQDTLTPAGVPYEMIATGLDNAGGTQPGGAGTPLNLSFVGPYTLSTTPPLTTFLGGPLPAGVNYNVGTYRYGFVQLFIPETYIAANCPLNYTNTFNLFNPKDRDGNLLGTDDPSNNFVTGSLTCTAPATPGAGPSTMGVTPQQSNNSATSGASTLGANETYFNNGSIPAGVFTGGEFEYNYIIRKSIPPVIVPQTFTNHILCLSNMTPTLHWFEDYPGQSSGTKAGPRDWSLSNVDSYTYATADLGAFDPYAYQVEYGIQGVGGSVPSNGTCDDGDATWYSSSSAVPGGVKNANKVRVKIPSYTCRINPNSNTEQGVYCRTNYTTHMRVSSTAVSGGTVASGSLPAGDRPYVYYTWKDDGAWKNTSGWGAAVTTALKTYSTSAGAAIPPTNNGGAGNYVLVKSAVARVTKNVATNFGTVCTSSGASAPCDVLTGSNYTYDYNLQPTFTGPGLPALQDSLKITDTLPSGVIYVSGSSKVGGVVTAPNQIVSNPDGSTTLVWILPNQIANTALPAITFKAYVSPTYSNGVVFTNKANIYSKYDPQSGTTDTEVYANVRTLVIGGFSVQKRATPLAQEITANTNIDFKLQYANTTTST
jgi:hypothetical protein